MILRHQGVPARSRLLRIAVLCASMAGLVAVPGLGRVMGARVTLYVSPTGSDSGDCSTMVMVILFRLLLVFLVILCALPLGGLGEAHAWAVVQVRTGQAPPARPAGHGSDCCSPCTTRA